MENKISKSIAIKILKKYGNRTEFQRKERNLVYFLKKVFNLVNTIYPPKDRIAVPIGITNIPITIIISPSRVPFGISIRFPLRKDSKSRYVTAAVIAMVTQMGFDNLLFSSIISLIVYFDMCFG